MKNISIFCGAHEGKNPEYAKAAKSVAEAIAKKALMWFLEEVMLA